jgi:hypothetical protein
MWYGTNHWNDRTLAYLQPFGRVEYVKLKRKIIGKFVKKSFKCMHVGHAEGHVSDTYRMYNPSTNESILTRVVKWAAWAPSKSTDSPEAIFEDKGIDDLEPVVPVKDHLANGPRGPRGLPPHVIPHTNEEAGRTGESRGLIQDTDEERATDFPLWRYESPAGRDNDAERNNADKAGNREENDAFPIEDNEESEESAMNAQYRHQGRAKTRIQIQTIAAADEDPRRASSHAENSKGKKIANAMNKLESYYNPLAMETKKTNTDEPNIVKDKYRMQEEVEGVALSATLTSDPGESKTFRQAMDGP